MQGEIDGGYESTVVLTLEDGTEVEYTEKGKIEAMTYSQAFTECKKDDVAVTSVFETTADPTPAP